MELVEDDLSIELPNENNKDDNDNDDDDDDDVVVLKNRMMMDEVEVEVEVVVPTTMTTIMTRQEEAKGYFHSIEKSTKFYLQLIRPMTLFQAVGAFTVGKLVILMQHNNLRILLTDNAATIIPKYLLASMSIYLSYGAGMAMNDIVDGNSIDVHHPTKKYRPIPSGKMSTKQGWIFVSALSFASYLLATLAATATATATATTTATTTVSSSSAFNNIHHPIIYDYYFPIWTLSNLFIMFSYSKLGLQKLFLVKNILVGYLSISPLLGAALLHPFLQLATTTTTTTTIIAAKGVLVRTLKDSSSSSLQIVCVARLLYLSIVGLGLGIAREIVKDMEDVDIDAVAGKLTVPMVFGLRASHAIAYTMVAAVCYITTCSTSFAILFAQRLGWGHILRTAPGVILSIRAALSKDISRGQSLLKRAIYAFLIGVVTGLIRIIITSTI